VCKITKNNENIYGVLIDNNNDFIFMHVLHEFWFDGYIIIPLNKISSITTLPVKSFTHKFIFAEKITPKQPEKLKSIDLLNYKTIFLTIKSKTLQIECSRIKNGYYFGPIVRVNEKSIRLGWFGPNADWGKPDTINYSSISEIRFGSKYLSAYEKYLDWPYPYR
jgi:hypothetical protein